MDNREAQDKFIRGSMTQQELNDFRKTIKNNPDLENEMDESILLKLLQERHSKNIMKQNIDKWKNAKRIKIFSIIAAMVVSFTAFIFFTTRHSKSNTSVEQINDAKKPFEQSVDTLQILEEKDTVYATTEPKVNETNILDTSYLLQNSTKNEIALVEYSKRQFKDIYSGFEYLPELRGSLGNENMILTNIDSLILKKSYKKAKKLIENNKSGISKYYLLPRIALLENQAGHLDSSIKALLSYQELVDNPDDLTYELLLLYCQNPIKYQTQIIHIFEKSDSREGYEDYQKIQMLKKQYLKYKNGLK